MITIGLTGGSGGGKSSVGRVFQKMGALFLDADEIYHTLLRSSENMNRELLERFGADMFENGRLSRKKLREVVFAQPRALDDLNAITHRYVSIETLRRLSSCTESAAVIDAIALIESGLGDLCDVTVGVLAPAEARIARIMARDALTRSQACSRLSAQKPDSYYAEHCDVILHNDSTPIVLEQKAAALFKSFLASLGSGRPADKHPGD